MGETHSGWRTGSAIVVLVGGLIASAYAATQNMDVTAVGLCFASVAAFIGMLSAPVATTAVIAAAWSIALAVVGQFMWATVMAVYGLVVAVTYRRTTAEPKRPELTLVHSS